MVFEGAIYILMFSVLLCALLQGLESARTRRAGPLLWTAAAVVLGLGLAGVKLFPMLDFMARNQRTFVVHHAKGFNPLGMTGFHLLYDAFLFSSYSTHLPFEDGAYLGVVPAALAVVGAVVSARRRWPWIATGAAFIVVAMGDGGVPGLWSELRHLPVLQQTIFPQRYLLGALLPVGLAAAEGIDWLRRRAGRLGAVIAIVGVVVTFADLTVNNVGVYAGMFTAVPPPLTWSGPLRGQVHSASDYDMLGPYRAGFGVLNAHPYLPHMRPQALALDDPTYRGELVATGGTATLASWTPNVVRVRVAAPAGAVRVVLNQNAAPGWEVEGAGSALDLDSARLAFTATSDGVVTLRYRPPFLLVGLASSAVALIACAGLAVGRRGRPAAPDAAPNHRSAR
ncbi:MAG TPA: hypothetical protein VLW17_07875 [Thermoanaerobaculaceae bacterium]|nr:hypothetical protein [Thermoanaerobaculaceae bacterium]